MPARLPLRLREYTIGVAAGVLEELRVPPGRGFPINGILL